MADLQELFSRIKAERAAQSTDTSRAQSQTGSQHPATGYRPPSVSSPLFSPPLQTPNPIHSSNVISPVIPSLTAASPAPDSNRTNLLNLLKFNGQATQQPGPMANLQNIGAARASSVHGSNQQDLLLGLLTKAKAPQPPAGPSLHVGSAQSAAPPTSTPIRSMNAPTPAAPPFEAPHPTQTTMFNYVNPFDQLHSSSPLNSISMAKPDTDTETKKINVLKHEFETSSHSISPEKSRKVEAMPQNLSVSDIKVQSVSEVLEGVSEEVDKQVEEAFARAEKGVSSTKSSVHEAKDTKKEPDLDWESAENQAALKEERLKVEVFNFPMRPFVSLRIKQTKKARSISQDHFLVIAQLKKEFDQIDRSLVTASQSHIVYAQVATKKDNGGLRIIRQDTGDHKQIFRSSGERVFNVQLCSSNLAAHDVETVLGTGASGSLFWTSLAKSRGDMFKDDDVEGQGFVLPPVVTAEENTSGSPVKTRAKLSSRHPEFFAMARGKQIFLVAPNTVKGPAYYNPTTRKVNSEKFFADHTLKLNTGKAGKDFCFSEDDSVIVSLDKNGRFKFWDIRDLTSRACDTNEVRHSPVELCDPLWTLQAATSGSRVDEKPSVSSIMFLDKERPTTKGCALRYIIIGFKQNHILQLWDLGLGKAVQEIRFPHDKDSDGICSLNYHPRTGIIALGHPTRNSVYFVHLSAPRYNVPIMDQARYIGMLARGDSALPKPESTAIMSGLREFSFAQIGQIRSVDMLKVPIENGSDNRSADETLFELYVMHSKGVVGVGIKRDDLGWDEHSKMVNPKDAVQEGVIDVSELVTTQKPSAPSEQQNVSEVQKVPKAATAMKKGESSTSEIQKNIENTEVKGKELNASTNGTARAVTTDTEQKRTKSEAPSADKTSVSQPPNRPNLQTNIAQPAESQAKEKAVLPTNPAKKAPTLNGSPDISSSASRDVQNMLSQQFESLYQRLDADKRIQEAAGGAKQDALLRIVSSTLTENVDRTLGQIVAKSIERDVLPQLSEITGDAIERNIAQHLPKQIQSCLTSAVRASLPSALQDVFKNREVQQTISNITANQVATKVQQQVSAVLDETLPGVATHAAKLVAESEKRINEKLQQAETQHRKDNAKIDELSALIRSLSTTIQSLADSQSVFQDQILKIQREARSAQPESAETATSDTTATRANTEPLDPEAMACAEMLVAGRYEDATVEWISSDRQAELFDKVFIRLDPSYIHQLPPLVALTVSVAVSTSFATNAAERLEWLGHVVNSIDIRNDVIKDVAPKIMDVISQRLSGAYMHIAETDINNSLLKTVSHVKQQVQEIRRLAG